MAELIALVTAIVVLFSTIITIRTKRQVQQVHVLTNSANAQLKRHIKNLTAALTAQGIRVPVIADPEDQREAEC
jgi:hypothetical protein